MQNQTDVWIHLNVALWYRLYWPATMRVKSKPFFTDLRCTWLGRVAKPTYSLSWSFRTHRSGSRKREKRGREKGGVNFFLRIPMNCSQNGNRDHEKYITKTRTLWEVSCLKILQRFRNIKRWSQSKGTWLMFNGRPSSLLKHILSTTIILPSHGHGWRP